MLTRQFMIINAETLRKPAYCNKKLSAIRQFLFTELAYEVFQRFLNIRTFY